MNKNAVGEGKNTYTFSFFHSFHGCKFNFLNSLVFKLRFTDHETLDFCNSFN